MKRLYLFVFLSVLIALASAQSFSLRFTPQTIKLNRLNTFDLDPVNPMQQANFTELFVLNQGAQTHFDLGITLAWNGTDLVSENELILRSYTEIGSGESASFSNRELITNSGGLQFEADANIDIIQRAKQVPGLEQALLAGYYPDGKLLLTAKIRPRESRNWVAEANFTIEVSNLASINLVSPGSAINQVPPRISGQMLSFYWSAFVPDFNQQQLLIKEFPPNLMPQSQNVDHAGRLVYESSLGVESGFSEAFPLNDGCYYAWKVYISGHHLENPYTVADRNRSNSPRLESPWYVFQYIENAEESELLDEFYIALMNLEDQKIINLLVQGFRATGELVLDGKNYSGADALSIIQSLQGKYIQTEIQD